MDVSKYANIDQRAMSPMALAAVGRISVASSAKGRVKSETNVGRRLRLFRLTLAGLGRCPVRRTSGEAGRRTGVWRRTGV